MERKDMENMKKVVRFVVLTHLVAMVMFSVHRGIELFVCRDMLQEYTGAGDLLICFMRGMAFDTHCSCEALTVPALILSVVAVAGIENKIAKRTAMAIASVVYFVQMGVCYANIPYLQYQMSNLTFTAMGALSNGGEVVGMMLSGEYLFFFVLGLAMCCAICAAVWLLGRRLDFVPRSAELKKPIMCAVGLLLVVFFGIRGTMFPYRPLTWKFANYSADPLANMICLNPWFYAERGKAGNWKHEYMGDEEAERIALSKLNYPMCVEDSAAVRKPHIFFIFMESMSAHYMRRFGNEERITPFIDSLFAESYSFPNFFSGGTRTNVGIFCAATGQQAVMEMMMTEHTQVIKKHLANAMNENGYRTQMFIPHEKSYDSLDDFLGKTVGRMYDLYDIGGGEKSELVGSERWDTA